MKIKTFIPQEKNFNDEDMTIEHYISTSDVDRYGDVLNPEGIDTENFRKNPIVLFSHNSQSQAAGKNISITADKYGVKAVTQFANTELGRELYRLNREGFMNAWSVGFIPKSKPQTKKINGTDVNYIDKWELLEYSSVAVPANPNCLNLIKKYFNTKNERNILMDENKSELINEKQIETISRKAASEIVKKELDDFSQILSAKIPTEFFRDKKNITDLKIQDGRNFIKSIVYTKPGLCPPQYKDYLNETNAELGANLVPEELYNEILNNIQQDSVVMRNASIYRMSRKELLIPKLDQLPAWSFVNEGELKPVSNPTFSQVILRRHDGGFIVLFSRQLLEDEAFDIMNFVISIAGQIFRQTIDRAGFRGYTDKIAGLFTNGNGTMISEVEGNEFNTLKYDDLIKLITSIPAHTLPNAKWYMHRSILGFIKSLKSTNGDFVMTSDDRKANTLEGYPIELSDECYSLTESQPDRAFIGFGDLKHMALGIRNYMTVDYSKEATVQMGNQTVNLWQSGLIGLNFNSSFDIKFTYPLALGVLKTAN